MIYPNYETVEERYKYAQEQLHEMMDRANSYIMNVLREAGTLEINIDNKPTVIALKGKAFSDDEHLAFYQNIAKPKTVWEFNSVELFDICKEIHKMNLVKE